MNYVLILLSVCMAPLMQAMQQSQARQLDAFAQVAASFSTAEDLERCINAYPGSVNETDACGKTPLYYAVMKNDVAKARVLLNHGASANIVIAFPQVQVKLRDPRFQEMARALGVTQAASSPVNGGAQPAPETFATPEGLQGFDSALANIAERGRAARAEAGAHRRMVAHHMNSEEQVRVGARQLHRDVQIMCDEAWGPQGGQQAGESTPAAHLKNGRSYGTWLTFGVALACGGTLWWFLSKDDSKKKRGSKRAD